LLSSTLCVEGLQIQSGTVVSPTFQKAKGGKQRVDAPNKIQSETAVPLSEDRINKIVNEIMFFFPEYYDIFGRRERTESYLKRVSKYLCRYTVLKEAVKLPHVYDKPNYGLHYKDEDGFPIKLQRRNDRSLNGSNVCEGEGYKKKVREFLKNLLQGLNTTNPDIARHIRDHKGPIARPLTDSIKGKWKRFRHRSKLQNLSSLPIAPPIDSEE